MSTAEEWVRPASSNFPIVYKEFEGRLATENGKKKFKIQDLTDEYVDVVMNAVLTGFAMHEPLNNCTKLWECPIAMEEMNEIWRGMLKHKLSLICLSVDASGNSKLAGFNILCRAIDKIEDIKLKSERFQKVLDLIIYVSNIKNACQELKVDAYLGAMGLYVLPEFRGEGLGLELLQAREPLCKAVGLKATVTVFSSIISQKLAERAGFKDLYNIPYDELVKIDKKYYIEGIQSHTKNIRLMYILY